METLLWETYFIGPIHPVKPHELFVCACVSRQTVWHTNLADSVCSMSGCGWQSMQTDRTCCDYTHQHLNDHTDAQHLRVNIINPFLNRNSCQWPLFCKTLKIHSGKARYQKKKDRLWESAAFTFLWKCSGENLLLCLSISRWINIWECQRLFFQRVAV